MHKHLKLILFLTLSLISTYSTSAPSQELSKATLHNFLDDSVATLSQYKGKVVYLDFWASWCIPCKKSFPFMNEMTEKYAGKDFEVIAINMDEFAADAKKFLQKYPAQFPIFVDKENVLASELKLPGLPVAYIIDKSGKFVTHHTGFSSKKVDKTLRQIDYLLEQE